MRRIFVVLAVVVVATLLVATSGLVAAKGPGGGGQGGTSFNLLGTVMEYSCDDPGYIKVGVVAPSHYGDEVTVQTDDNTSYKQCTGTGTGVPSSCDALATSPTVRIMGTVTVDGGGNISLVATRVILY